MDLVAEWNNEDTKRKIFQVFKGFFFVFFFLILKHFRNFKDCLFCYDTKYKEDATIKTPKLPTGEVYFSTEFILQYRCRIVVRKDIF